MSDTVIRVENISKKYVLDHQQEGGSSYKSLRDVIANGASSLLKPLTQNSKPKTQNSSKEEFWALKDVSFEIKQGDRVGIIGRNGAGKSTLLKVLSRIVEPTAGRIGIKGRVASLLEVGTGFHPELTGRENVYLNGAILGMSKVEIQRKFDEIVAFAEVEKFLDTPVKRYSSGMYVRLAFAVAAHLEPEILIVDEVLAVGDASFQKKCLGKMEEVGREGRTVIFVSHNVQAVSRLTNRCVYLEKGERIFEGSTEQALEVYNKSLSKKQEVPAFYEATHEKKQSHLALAKVYSSREEGIHDWGKPIIFEFSLKVKEPSENLCFSFQVVDDSQRPICHFWFLNSETQEDHKLGYLPDGLFRLQCKVPEFRLYMGSYTLTTWLTDRRSNDLIENLTEICHFDVTMSNIHRESYEWASKACTYLEESNWELSEILQSKHNARVQEISK